MKLTNILPKSIIVILVFAIIVFIGYKTYMSKFSAKKYFTDKKVIALCNAAKEGDVKKIDKLLAEGVNINTIGKTGLNPIYWLLVMNKSTDKQRIGFQYLLKKGANAMQVHKPTGWNLIHTTAQYEDPRYLKMILDYGKNLDLDAEIENDGWPLALMQAELTNRFENFKLLLDHGASINKWNDNIGRTVLTDACDKDNWIFAYELLKRGADYTIKKKNQTNMYIIKAIASSNYSPSGIINFYGTDYRQKVVQFLREKGVEVNPWMPEDEKYVKENSEDVLYVKENDKWIKFTESSKYTGPFEDPDRQLTVEEWNSGKKANHGSLGERFYNFILGLF